MIMMTVMMVMSRTLAMINVTFCLVTMLIFRFKLQSHVSYPVFTKLFTDSVLDFVRVSFRNHVHGGVIVTSVDAPSVYMMHVYDSVDLAKMLAYLTYFNIVGCSFKKDVYYFLEISHRVYENKYGNAD